MNHKTRSQIPYPDELEIRAQVSEIVQKGLSERRSALKQLIDFIRQVGWQSLLPNRNEVIFSCVMVAVVIILGQLFFFYGKTVSPFSYGYAILCSPIAFLAPAAYSFYEKVENHTFETEMSTKFTVFQVIACRLVMFSGMAILMNMTLAIGLAANEGIDFIRLWLISLSGLFIFSGGLFMLLSAGSVYIRTAVFTAGWIILNGLLLVFAHDVYIQLLVSLPVVVYVFVAAAAAGLSVYGFIRFFTRKQEGLGLC